MAIITLVMRRTRATGAQTSRSFLLGVIVFIIRANEKIPTMDQLANVFRVESNN